jgi:hypothetical protein
MEAGAEPSIVVSSNAPTAVSRQHGSAGHQAKLDALHLFLRRETSQRAHQRHGGALGALSEPG